MLALFHSLCSMYFGVQSLTLQPRVELVFVNLFESQINGSKIRFLCFQTVFAWCLFYVFVYLFSLCSVLAFFPPFILFFGLCHFNTDRFLFRSSPSFLYRFFSIHSFRCFVFYFTLFFLSASLSLTLGGVQLKRRERFKRSALHDNSNENAFARRREVINNMGIHSTYIQRYEKRKCCDGVLWVCKSIRKATGTSYRYTP